MDEATFGYPDSEEESVYPAPSEPDTLQCSASPPFTPDDCSSVQGNACQANRDYLEIVKRISETSLIPAVPMQVERGAPPSKPTMFVVDFGGKSVEDVSLQKAFTSYKKEKQVRYTYGQLHKTPVDISQ